MEEEDWTFPSAAKNATRDPRVYRASRGREVGFDFFTVGLSWFD